MNIDLNESINNIDSIDDFVAYISALSDDYLCNKDEWQNGSISDYLESIGAWVKDYSACPNNDIEWDKVDLKTFARILYVGKIYE